MPGGETPASPHTAARLRARTSPCWSASPQSSSRCCTLHRTLSRPCRANSRPPKLAMTYAAEAAIPFFVLGLFVVQRPRIGWLGFGGALAYAYAYVFFASTVVYALVNSTPDFDTLSDEMGAWIPVHGAIMVLGGLAFGTAVIRARVLPAWTGLALIAGVVLVAAASGAPEIAQTASAGVRDLAFLGMGAALLSGASRQNAR